MIDTTVTWPDGHHGRLIWLDRDDWGGGPIRHGHQVPARQFHGWALHHTVMVLADYDRDGFAHGDLDDVRRYMQVLQAARADLGSEVPYSVVVFRGQHPHDVILAEGRGPGRTGAHTIGFNSSRYAWAIAGNTMTEPVTPGMTWGMRWIAHRWTPDAHARTFGHSEVYATACPGNHGRSRLPELQPPFLDPVMEDDDMLPDERQALFTSQAAIGRIQNEQLPAIRQVLAELHHGTRRHAEGLAEIVVRQVVAGVLAEIDRVQTFVDIDADAVVAGLLPGLRQEVRDLFDQVEIDVSIPESS